MTAIQYLSQARRLNSTISAKLIRIDRLRALATRTVGQITAMPPAHGQTNTVCDYVARIVDLSDEVDKYTDQMIQVKRRIQKTINRLPDPRHKQLLTLRYIYCVRWEGIAQHMDCTVNHAKYKIHKNALRDIQNLVDSY